MGSETFANLLIHEKEGNLVILLIMERIFNFVLLSYQILQWMEFLRNNLHENGFDKME
ncbi:MAG: hypothetical protein N3D17_06990 [bacterium]|nr:hypothetical protein [bacterium]